MVSPPASLKLTVFQLFEFSVHFFQFLFFFSYDWVFLGLFVLSWSYGFIKLAEVFPLNPCLLLNFSHFLMHYNVFWPFWSIFLVEHFEFVDISHSEIFSFRLPDGWHVIHIEFSFNSLVASQIQAKLFLLKVVHHRDSFNQVKTYILIWFYLFFRVLGCDIFGHLLGWNLVFLVFYFLLQVFFSHLSVTAADNASHLLLKAMLVPTFVLQLIRLVLRLCGVL